MTDIQTLDFTPEQSDVIQRMGGSVYLEFQLSGNGSRLNMANWSVSFKVRPTPSSAKVLLAGNLNVSGSSDTNMGWISQTMGDFTVQVPPTAFPNTIFPSNEDVVNAVWDIYATNISTGDVYPVTFGNWIISREVDR
jgi:hypothetical protein